MKILIPDFDDIYQHYSDRRPAWIKLPRKLLKSYAFCRLTAGDRFVFIGLLVLATENASMEGEGVVEASVSELAFALDLVEGEIAQRVETIRNIGLIRVDP